MTKVFADWNLPANTRTTSAFQVTPKSRIGSIQKKSREEGKEEAEEVIEIKL